MQTFRAVWLLRNLSLDSELFLRDGKNAAFRKSLPSLIVADEPGKPHALRAHIPEGATDWLNPLSLGTMSASAYIENLA